MLKIIKINNYKFKESNKFLRGFTMLELIIAVSLLLFGVIGIYGAFSSVNTVASNVSNRFIAAYLAQEGLEIVRNIRDSNYIQGRVWTQDHLLDCSEGCEADYTTQGDSLDGTLSHMNPYNPNNFLKIDEDGFYGYASGNSTKFKRKITIIPEGADALKVDISVMWDYNGELFSFQTAGYLYNWY